MGLLQFNEPVSVTVLDPAPGDLADEGPVAVVADLDNHRLALWRLRDGSLLRHLGSHGDAPGQFLGPRSVAVTRAGELVVGDGGNRRVQVLTVTGTCVCVLDPSSVLGVGSLSDWLLGVAVYDTTGEVMVSDGRNGRVVALRRRCDDGVFTSADHALAGCVGARAFEGDGAGRLSEPQGCVVMGTGRMWVADYERHRVWLFR